MKKHPRTFFWTNSEQQQLSFTLQQEWLASSSLTWLASRELGRCVLLPWDTHQAFWWAPLMSISLDITWQSFTLVKSESTSFFKKKILQVSCLLGLQQSLCDLVTPLTRSRLGPANTLTPYKDQWVFVYLFEILMSEICCLDEASALPVHL